MITKTYYLDTTVTNFNKRIKEIKKSIPCIFSYKPVEMDFAECTFKIKKGDVATLEKMIAHLVWKAVDIMERVVKFQITFKKDGSSCGRHYVPENECSVFVKYIMQKFSENINIKNCGIDYGFADIFRPWNFIK